MTRFYLPVCIALVSLLASCSVFKPLKKSDTPPGVHSVTITSPDDSIGATWTPDADSQDSVGTSGNIGRRSRKQATRQETSPDNLAKQEKMRPVIVFAENECQHVRLPLNLNNPFPASGEFEINLTELADEFCYPYPGKMISPFGPRGRSMHSGMDIKAVPNDTIRAAFDGVVRFSKVYSGYGNMIVIRHYNGIETAYGHQSKNLVKVNDVVKAGDPIGLAGRTGRATTEHLHFELRVASTALNPTLILDHENQKLKTGTLYLSNKSGKVVASNQPITSSGQYMAENTSGQPTATTAESTPAGNQPSAISSIEGTPVYHTIKKGDTLYHLARTYSTTVNRICELNGIRANKVLQIKERIRVK